MVLLEAAKEIEGKLQAELAGGDARGCDPNHLTLITVHPVVERE